MIANDPLPDESVDIEACWCGSLICEDVTHQGEPDDVTPISSDAPSESVALSEDSLAMAFTRRHGQDWRFVAAWGKWLCWDGSVWRFEPTLQVFDLSRAVCRDAALDEDNPRVGARLASAQTRAAVVSLAQADRAHAATVEQWDADPLLLATPDGVVDLKTGSLRPASREDYLTKITAVGPRDMPTPLWDAFLTRVMGGDRELVAFLQRVAGYALTGETKEHALFFMHGLGANGKSTFSNALTGLFGDYTVTASMETFVVGPTDKHPTDLAMLRGSRLVTAQETESGKRWAEARLKALTGGDAITARFMRQDFFTYMPQFKLLLSGNHRPSLRDVDDAIRRRFHLVPFTETIPAAERDLNLPAKLRAEWPGILAWAIRGCLQWQSAGLLPPERVQAATDAYFAAEDTVARWIEECCETGRQHEDTIARLFDSWKQWATTAQEYEGSKKRFSQRLEERGFVPAWVNRVRGLRGIRVRS